MDRIRDLTDAAGRDDDLLRRTSGGILDSQYLSEEPPAAYLHEREQPQYVLRNKKSGVKIAQGPSVDSHTPDGDHQALAVITDVRILFLVGNARGDECETLDLSDVVEARADSAGLLASTLVIETVDGGTWKFPCRGDVSAVAEYIEDAAQTWANANRLVEEASDHLPEVENALANADFAAARDVLATVTDGIETAEQRIASLGDGAIAAFRERAAEPIAEARQFRREIAATKGAHHHANAQEAWKRDHDFDRAAEEYDRALTEYERAIETNGEEPPVAALAARRRGALQESEVLRVAPMADARAARDVARERTDPEVAAAEWETALTCYREATGLDWGSDDREFVVDRERAREGAAEATDAAIDAHLAAGREWLRAGDEAASEGSRESARDAYERAEAHFENAGKIARELAPGRVDAVDDALDDVTARIAREGPPGDEPVETDYSVAAIWEWRGQTTGQGPAPSRQSAVPVTEKETILLTDDDQSGEVSEPTPAITPLERGETETTPSGEAFPTPAVTPLESNESSADDEDTSPAVQPAITPLADAKSEPADATPRVKPAITPVDATDRTAETSQEATGAGETGGDETNEKSETDSDGKPRVKPAITPIEEKDPATPDSEQATAGQRAPAQGTDAGGDPQNGGTGERAEAGAVETGDGGTQATAVPAGSGVTAEQVDTSTVVDKLRALEESVFTDLVADTWAARGWTTTVFTASGEAVYDVVAMRSGEDGDERLLIWTEHRPDGGTLGATAIERCATARDSSRGADQATLVTTGTLTSAAYERADARDVTVVTATSLAERVVEAGLAEDLQ